jgi:hypothetical protein
MKKKVIRARASKVLEPMSVYLRRSIPLYAALSLLFALSAFAQGGGAPATAPPPRIIRAFAFHGAEWAWIVATGERTELQVGGPDGQVKRLAEGADWFDVALDAESIWLIERRAGKGRLLRLPKGRAGEPEEVLAGLDRPGALRVSAAGLQWLEATRPADPGLAHVPTLGGMLRLRQRTGSGEVTTLAEWPAGGLVTPRHGDVIGELDGATLVSVQAGMGTEFYAVTPSAAPSRLGGEGSEQHGVISGGRLVWTAPSDEATEVSGIRCLRGRKGREAVQDIADWLPSGGTLLSIGDRLHYTARGEVYRFPGASPLPQHVGSVPFGPVATDDRLLVSLSGAVPAGQAP